MSKKVTPTTTISISEQDPFASSPSQVEGPLIQSVAPVYGGATPSITYTVDFTEKIGGRPVFTSGVTKYTESATNLTDRDFSQVQPYWGPSAY